MPIDPTSIIGEILGTRAAEMRNPVNVEYRCPFINSECVKRSQRIAGPYPVCSLYKWARGSPSSDLVCVCPKRFFEVDIRQDVIRHCWPDPKPTNPQIASEVKMAGFGQVDFVIADIGSSGEVRDFLSVELQAIDITGSYEPAYTAVLNSATLSKKPTYNFNYANVRKRYHSQLISKGFYHHHWNSRIVAVLQDHVFARIHEYAHFDELPVASSNIVFMLYRFTSDSAGHHLIFDRTVGTSHSSLMTGVLYRTPPSREVFCARILKQLSA